MSLTDDTLSDTVDGSGNATIRFVPRRGQNWEVQQATTQAPTIGPTALCKLYRSGVFIANIFPNNGVGSGLPYVKVRQGQNFEFRWTGGAVGAAVTAAILYDDGNP